MLYLFFSLTISQGKTLLRFGLVIGRRGQSTIYYIRDLCSIRE